MYTLNSPVEDLPNAEYIYILFSRRVKLVKINFTIVIFNDRIFAKELKHKQE